MAEQKTEQQGKISEKIISQIKGAENILVALTSDPSVDEMSAALGLTLFLDKMGKHATAIYSGTTPNALEFLDPGKTFEPNTNSLQDFIIALNKEKADHLRYKVDGDFVKIYITPYRTTLSESDLEFSHGDFNVDLVIALNVMAATDLDGALREHGRIMHDASSINITTNPPGKFGEIEWSNIVASSVSEMAASLAYALSEKGELEKETATAFLTGIVASTNRFSNERTSSDTMILAAKLMGSGADPQLIASNLVGDESTKKVNGYVETSNKGQVVTNNPAAEAPASNDGNMVIERNENAGAQSGDAGLDLRGGNNAAEASPANQPMTEDDKLAQTAESLQAFAAPAGNVSGPEAPNQVVLESPQVAEVQPVAPVTETGEKDYAKMIDEALAEPLPGEVVQPNVDQTQAAAQPIEIPLDANPAATMAPQVPAGPEVNNVPEIPYDNGIIDNSPQPAAMGNDSYLVETPKTVVQPPAEATLPMPDAGTLPPTPPTVDFAAVEAQPAAAPVEQQPAAMPAQPVVEQPVQPQPVAAQPQMAGGMPVLPQVQAQPAPEQPAQPQAQPVADAGAFQIPGM
ncbi:hypothetical protein IJI94_03350 [Candidatus Saccharibacteria bacterium]|nr:hypothetical protein [Candidatus Saccharibacteria bacterium]